METLSLETAILAPPDLDSVTVQVLDIPVLRVTGEQTSEVTEGGAVSAIVAVRIEVLSEAVTVAV